MNSLIEGIRSIIGQPDFYFSSGQINYGAVTEYFVACLVLLVCVASVFKFLLNLVK